MFSKKSLQGKNRLMIIMTINNQNLDLIALFFHMCLKMIYSTAASLWVPGLFEPYVNIFCAMHISDHVYFPSGTLSLPLFPLCHNCSC